MMTRKDAERLNILGCPIDSLSFEETIAMIDDIIRHKVPRQHVVINVSKLLQARRDTCLAEIIASCYIINPDGMPIVWASKILGKPLKEKISGIDLMNVLIKHSAEKGYRIYFLGAKDEVVKKVVDVCGKQYPELQIAGYRNGYWEESEEKEIVAGIKVAVPDIIFVAISSPKKEIFLKRNLDDMQVPFVMGVGGSFDVLAGKTKRAPLWMQKSGLEWFYRLLQEPKRLWKRYLIGNSVFICLVVKEFFRKRVCRRK